MLAIELVHDPEHEGADADVATEVVEHAARHGLLLLKSGIYSNCIRVLTPLVLADAELDEALGVWEAGARARARRLTRPAARRYRRDRGRRGRSLERYELEELVGTGGMSSVFRARDRLLERPSR